VWLNPQIVLITATTANKIGTQTTNNPPRLQWIQRTDSNEYLCDHSYRQPGWQPLGANEHPSVFIANHYTIFKGGKRLTRSLYDLLMKNGVKISHKTLKVSAGVKICYTALAQNPKFRNFLC